jgi:hypothetical protein
MARHEFSKRAPLVEEGFVQYTLRHDADVAYEKAVPPRSFVIEAIAGI